VSIGKESHVDQDRFLVALLTAAVIPVAAPRAAMSLAERSQGSVSYVSGGIGEDQAAALRQAAANYSLTLELASAAGGPRGAYVSNAKVDIWDASGKDVLDITAEGPLVLVKLPSGTYHVAVNWNGMQRDKTVTLGGERRQHLMLEFPDAPGTN
jgi:hypothetical protein